MNVLVINAGSSSLKYQLIDMRDKSVLAKGICERIGIGGKIKHTPCNGKPVYKSEEPFPDHEAAISKVISLLTDGEHGVISSMADINAVGHRVVHGGEYFSHSVIIDDSVIEKIKKCVPLAPLHNPAALTGIYACMDIMKGIPQAVVFDTAFHQTMPPESYIYPIPYKYYLENKVRRYGFHGTSHRYVSAKVAELMGKPIEQLKIVTCHLGNGSSIAAVDGGKVLDTSMGFTPLDGLPMGTRSGSLDPAIVEYIAKVDNIGVDQVLEILNKQSGVLGISQLSSDFRDLDDASDAGNAQAKLALDIFLYNVKKYIGAYAAAMGGIDAIAFAGGVGENGPNYREIICDGLAFLGVKIDKEVNNVKSKELDLTAPGASVHTFLIPTNEELVIAEDTCELVSAMK